MASHEAGASPAPLRGFVDGLGQRVVTRTTTGASFEALRLSAAFAGGARFEHEVRETLASIASFSHPAFPPAPRIERLSTSDGRPVLVSAYQPGRRLLALLRQAQGAGRTITTSTTLFIVRDTLQALRAAHCAVPGFFHGALGPERIVVTPDLRVLVVEHVLGRGLSVTLPADPGELWRRFGIAVPVDPALPPFGPETDQLQIGLIALALMLGRPLAADEYPDRVAELADAARETDLLGRPSPLGPALREWVSRLLFISTNGPYPDLEAAENDLAVLLSDEGGYVAAPIGFDVEPEVLEELPVRGQTRTGSPPGPPVRLQPEATPDESPHLRLIEPGQPGEVASRTQSAGPVPVESRPAAEATVPCPATGAVQTRPAENFVPLETPQASVQRALDAATVDGTPEPHAPILEAVEPVELSVFSSQREPDDRESESPRADLIVRDQVGEFGQRPAALPAAPSPPAAPDTVGTPRVEEPVLPAPSPFAGPRPAPSANQNPFQLSVGLPGGTFGEPWEFESASTPKPGSTGIEAPPEAGGEGQALAPSKRRRIPTRLLIVAASALVLLTTGVVGGGYYFLSGGGPPGRLLLESAPAGATVLVEGRPLGKTPVSVELPPGLHYVEIQGLHSSYTLAVQIRSRIEVRERVSLPEAGKPATLVVRTEPPGVAVTVDGQPRGEGSLTLQAVPPGRHLIAAANEVGRVEREVVLAPAGRVEVTLAVSGWIDVQSPLPVQTTVDGRPIGARGPIALTPGRHRVEFVNTELGLRDAQDVIVEAGRTTAVVVSGTTGGLDLTADVPAEVFIDGRPAGRTPLLNLTLPLGKHEVRFSSPRLGDVRYEIAIRPGTNSLHGTFGAAPTPAQRALPPRRIR